MKKLILAILASIMLVACGEKKDAKKTETEKQLIIGINQFVEHPALDASRKGFIDALKKSGYEDGKKIKIDFQNAQGDMSIAQTIGKSMSADYDLILAIATPSAQAAYNSTKEIPILITAVTDPVAAGLVKDMKKSGTNVSGTSDMTPIDKQFELIKKLIPNAKKIGIVYSTSEQNSLVQVAWAKEVAAKLGFEIVEKGITNVNEMSQALDAILTEVDVLYTPTDNLIVASTPLVVDKTLKAKIPLIGCIEDQVKQGALATETIDYYKLGYQTGEMAIRILNGEKPADMAVETMADTELMINEKTAKDLGIIINAEVLKTAKIIK